MSVKLLKITYQGQSPAKKLSAYLRMPSPTYAVLRREIDIYLFQERQLPKAEFRTFWIDDDNDEIEIINQNDYEIFLGTTAKPLRIAAIEEVVETKAPSTPGSSDDPSNFIIHDTVECDSCGLHPLVGFRYKCIQCPNFDLCQGCEAAHKHSEHMMVRMPTNDGPSVVEAWLSGPGHSGRRSGRRHQRGQCPFAESAQATTPTATGCEHKEGRRERRHARRHGGVLSQFVEMMMNLPESNTPVATPTTSTATPKVEKQEPTPSAPPAEVKPKTVSDPEAVRLQETPKTAEPVAAPRCPKEAPEPSPAQTETPQSGGGAATTPTTPVINLENLSQIVPPEYMRAGIEILNNFSEMFAKMIDPSESANYSASEPTSVASASASQAAEAAADAATAAAKAAAAAVNASTAAANATSAAAAANLPTPPTGTPESVSLSSSSSTESSQENEPLLATPLPINAQKPKEEAERRRSDSLEHDWQMIDNTGSPASTEALINLSAGANPTPAAAPVATPNFGQLGEILRQHISEEQQREQATAHTQTAQVATVTTSTSTNSVTTSSTGTSPSPPEEKRSVPVYHTDERINSAIHAMMAMGFSNEGAWLTQLLESVQGNIPAALDIMHSSQSSN